MRVVKSDLLKKDVHLRLLYLSLGVLLSSHQICMLCGAQWEKQ